MFGYIDPILFPDQLTVVELTEGQYVYPIHKNASSLIKGLALHQLNYREIEKLTVIDVYLRDPFERYVSGVQTWLRYNPEYDRETALKFIRDYLFLNNHFSLQFHWIVNLARITEARIHIRDLGELDLVTDQVWHAVTRDESLVEFFHNNTKLHFYLQLDKVLYEELMGQTVTFRQIKKHIQHKYPFLYDEIIQRSKDICNALD